ncbi:MAG: hypothetical protein A2603_06510 [Bdellovibrionales bacterium RIFOXYD1_FULL_55_31]|nr:MAG: hypothetical protein A2603_06510 [Bdellovibrionales bacterium RIFOXYD1_FULL_55_31]
MALPGFFVFFGVLAAESSFAGGACGGAAGVTGSAARATSVMQERFSIKEITNGENVVFTFTS